jgi:hypothetical protein
VNARFWQSGGMVGPSEYDDDWDSLIRGDGWDGSIYRSALVALATSAKVSAVRQFFPFTSVNQLSFARGSTFRSTLRFDDEQPVCVAFTAQGIYSVLEGSRYHDEATLLLETRDPVAAVAVVCERLGL